MHNAALLLVAAMPCLGSRSSFVLLSSHLHDLQGPAQDSDFFNAHQFAFHDDSPRYREDLDDIGSE